MLMNEAKLSKVKHNPALYICISFSGVTSPFSSRNIQQQ